MPSVTVWLYPTAFGAETGEAHLTALVERGALVVHDAVAVSWVPSDPEPRVRHLGHLTARAAACCCSTPWPERRWARPPGPEPNGSGTPASVTTWWQRSARR
jgi:hypothetical protein